MAKQPKVWRVKADYDGTVTLEQECKHVVLSNRLSQEDLAEIALNPVVVGFMELVTQPAIHDGE
jgi:hypothetical protein